jgi:hypothetical protein
VARQLRAPGPEGRARRRGTAPARGSALTIRLRDLIRNRPFLLEVFVASNLAFLVLDVFVAHSINAFRHPAEWIPLAYASLAALALLVNLALRGPWPATVHSEAWRRGAGRRVGIAVGWGGIAVGLAGLLWHLESGFFRETTLAGLVYAAPFSAPLAFAGLGFLALFNRVVPSEEPEWGRGVLLLAWGGFVGCFALALGDHAQNGFFRPAEWIAVAAGAVAVAVLLLPLVARIDSSYLSVLLVVLGMEAGIGLLGFALHALPILRGSEAPLVDRILYGAPPFAPLLFTDLALLGILAAWDLRDKGTA